MCQISGEMRYSKYIQYYRRLWPSYLFRFGLGLDKPVFDEVVIRIVSIVKLKSLNKEIESIIVDWEMQLEAVTVTPKSLVELASY